MTIHDLPSRWIVIGEHGAIGRWKHPQSGEDLEEKLIGGECYYIKHVKQVYRWDSWGARRNEELWQFVARFEHTPAQFRLLQNKQDRLDVRPKDKNYFRFANPVEIAQCRVKNDDAFELSPI